MSFLSILEAGYMGIIEEQALINIKKERSRFDNIWKVVHDYCKNNKLMVSNKYVLTDDENNVSNTTKKIYEIYTYNPFRHANNLTNKIYQAQIKNSDAKYTRLKTIQEKEEFMIEYDFRQIVHFNKLQKHNGEPYDIVKPVEINNILYLPSEIELIDIYHLLYDPSKYDDIQSSLKFEKILFDRVSKRKQKGILGAGCCPGKRNILEAIKVGLIREWLDTTSNVVLIGAWAKEWVKNGKKANTNNEKIQLIGKNNPDELLAELQKYTKTFTNFDVSFKEQSLNIPKDFRTKRYTYYIHIPTERGITEKPFLDLFNCLEFELIPTEKIKGVCVGNKWVILRFLFIDLWILRIIQGLKLLSNDILNKKINYIWDLILHYKKAKDGKYQYVGIHRDFNTDKKTSNMQGKRFYPYYPHVYMHQYNKYREI